jgi:glycosyltransferase involved in cell wall biosynthesis
VTSQDQALRYVAGDEAVTAPAADPEALLDAIVRALNAPTLSDDARGRRQARAQLWRWDRAGQALATVLNDATDREVG